MGNSKEIAIRKSAISPSWYTPPYIIEAVREVLGTIDLDPASCRAANRNVRAKKYYSIFENGLERPWYGKVFLNAPGGRGHHTFGHAKWQKKLLSEYRTGNVTEAIMLIYNSSGTETEWFHDLLGNFPLCLTNHRIKFIPLAGKYEDESKNSPLNGNAFVYLGPNEQKFTEVFSSLGKVVPPFEKFAMSISHHNMLQYGGNNQKEIYVSSQENSNMVQDS